MADLRGAIADGLSDPLNVRSHNTDHACHVIATGQFTRRELADGDIDLIKIDTDALEHRPVDERSDQRRAGWVLRPHQDEDLRPHGSDGESPNTLLAEDWAKRLLRVDWRPVDSLRVKNLRLSADD